MSRIHDMLLVDIRSEILALGTRGGRMSPSVYDTAQYIRLAPASHNIWPAFEWVVGQQQEDGGWGDSLIPHARDTATLAAVLALTRYGHRGQIRTAIADGVSFLRRQMSRWGSRLPEDMPVGVELVLPSLLHEAEATSLAIHRPGYAVLEALGQKRRARIAAIPVTAGTPLAHSWEALQRPLDASVLDATGGVGHSPAATVAWLHATATYPGLGDAHNAAEYYLVSAAEATYSGIPGVLPTAWPIDRFELAFALYMLLCAGVLQHPGIQDVLTPQLVSLKGSLRSSGVGFSDQFMADGDDTTCAIAVLRAAGYSCGPEVIARFAHEDHYCAYAGELQAALSVTAHAVHALALGNDANPLANEHLLRQQRADGTWGGDKWNGSWLYSTSQVLIALGTQAPATAVGHACEALLSHQQHSGAWGARGFGGATAEETAYGVLALAAILRHPAFANTEAVRQALHRGGQWLLANYTPFGPEPPTNWLAKVMYKPHRITRITELAAMLAYVGMTENDDSA